MDNIAKFRTFVQEMTRLVGRLGDDEPAILAEGGALLGRLVAEDDWLPDLFAEAHPDYYQQHLLYCDPLEQFSVVSFVWGPGQGTPVHDHMVWGLIGMLRGRERAVDFSAPAEDQPLVRGAETLLEPGVVANVSPTIGDIHQVSNALDDRPSISIHVYGGNIGAVDRHIFDAETGRVQPFVSGYVNDVVPNLWDRSAEVRAAMA
jgi:predicted metal-dependent enzyme (double-stranded beta helix superfamily)